MISNILWNTVFNSTEMNGFWINSDLILAYIEEVKVKNENEPALTANFSTLISFIQLMCFFPVTIFIEDYASIKR